jgi:hypothetical protein
MCVKQIILGLALIAAVGSMARAEPVQCFLSVDGHTYIDKICEHSGPTTDPESHLDSFQLGGEYKTTPKKYQNRYFVNLVNLSGNKATGFWNGTSAGEYAHDALGSLYESVGDPPWKFDSCWVNDRVQVCFGKAPLTADEKIDAQVADAEYYDVYMADHDASNSAWSKDKPEVCTGKLIRFHDVFGEVLAIAKSHDCSFTNKEEWATVLANCKIGQKCSISWVYIDSERLVHAISAKKINAQVVANISEHGKPNVCIGKLIRFSGDLNGVQHVRFLALENEQECSLC